MSANVCFRPIADITPAWDVPVMTTSIRIGALDIAEAIHERIGTYVDMNFIQFLSVDRDRIHCWYMNSDGDGPTFHIELLRSGEHWSVGLTEHPAGTEQDIEVP